MRQTYRQRCLGQAVIELAVILAAISALMVCLLLIGVVGKASIQSSSTARMAAFDCDVRPQHCRDFSAVTLQKSRATALGGDSREVFAVDYPKPKAFLSAQRNADVISRIEDLRLTVDLPRVDGADKGLLAKLSEAFRAFTLRAGPLVFGLPSPDQLTRVRFEQQLWGSQGLSLSGAPRVLIAPASTMAMISDSWAAYDRQHFTQTVKQGESPSAVSDSLTAGFYLLAKDGLMPILDFVGLEADTGPFRRAFRQVDHDVAYGNSRVNISGVR